MEPNVPQFLGSLGQGTSDTAQTPGILRRAMVSSDGFWLGTAITPPGEISAWHHHGEWDSYVYLLQGSALVEFGHGGRDSLQMKAGDFFRVPGHAVHRESNPGPAENVLVVVRLGTGDVVVNVEGPED